MYEEDFYKDNGVAYNSENFEDESSLFDTGYSCECPCWEECLFSEEEVKKYCQVWRECREGTL